MLPLNQFSRKIYGGIFEKEKKIKFPIWKILYVGFRNVISKIQIAFLMLF